MKLSIEEKAKRYDEAIEQCIHHIFSKENMKPRIYLSGPISGHDIEERRKAFKGY